MSLSEFETRLRSRAAPERALEERPTDEPPGAAVAVILAGQELEIPLIRRSENPRDPWSGHMALPGGRRDPADVNLEATAMRETFEEIGVTLDASHAWGPLPIVSAMSGGKSAGFRVQPFVFRLPSRPDFTTNDAEVAELVWIPAREFVLGARETTFTFERGGVRFPLPAWDFDGRIVWGLTHRVLFTFLGAE